MKHALWQSMMLIPLSLCVHAQSAHDSMLCSLTRAPKGPVESLSAIHLDIAIHDRKVSNIKISPSEGPRRIMVLRDMSGSMNGTNEQKLSLEAIKDLVWFSQATDEFALIDFNDKPHLEIDLQNADRFSKQLDDFQSGKPPDLRGHTAIFDAIYNAAMYLQKSPQEGDSIVVITDGEDNASTVNLTKLREYLLRSKIRFYLFLLSAPVTTPGGESKSRELVQLMIDTGGRLTGVASETTFMEPSFDAGPRTIAVMRERVAALQYLIKKSYRVEFDLDSPLIKQTKLNIKMVANDNKLAKGLQIFCPAYLYYSEVNSR